jgi:hypothetical protein
MKHHKPNAVPTDRVPIPLTPYGSLDVAALGDLSPTAKRQLLRALNERYGAYRFEDAAAHEATFQQQFKTPARSKANLIRRDAARRHFEREFIAPRIAQVMLQTALAQAGQQTGRARGIRENRRKGDETRAKVQETANKLRLRGVPAHGMAARIAKEISRDRSTVARYLRTLKK